MTTLFLFEKTTSCLSSFPQFKFTDIASIEVLARACMESLLVFHYVFMTPSKDERQFRYDCYELGGLIERQSYPKLSDIAGKILDEEKTRIETTSAALKSNKLFCQRSPGEQEKLLRGEWRLKQWHEIAKDLGMSEIMAKSIYKNLCGYSHSSSPSVRITAQATLNHDEKSILHGTLSALNIINANMIKEYCSFFSTKPNEVFSQDNPGQETVKLWIKVGQTLDDSTN